ncbi:MAG: AzlC family ABC transporter permease [Eubacterium sp.]|nr:AzlC family ABC transporter permease [Eubacterium sp.]
MDKQIGFRRGLLDGLPIGLGYLSVSFTFGIMAILMGLYWWEAVLISMLNVTSAGQLAGITVMLSPGHYVEMLISQLTINIRYSFMSISLSQKVTDKFTGIWRWLFGFMITDEIFAVSVSKPVVRRSYFAGLTIMPYIGWTGGTLLGACLGDILPDSVMSALGIAIYAMFVAIVVPMMKEKKPVIGVVCIAGALSCAFTFVPGLNRIPAGIAISICAVAAALLMSFIKPVNSEELAEEDAAAAEDSFRE